MRKYHDVSDLRFEGGEMILTIDGHVTRYKIRDISPVLLNATRRERNTYRVSPSGYGVHWLLVDEDLSIDGFPGITHNKKTAKLA